MQVFRVLFLKASNSEQLAVLMDEVEKSLKPGWERDRTLENDLRTDVFRTKPVYCFVQGRGRPPPVRHRLSSRGGVRHFSSSRTSFPERSTN